MDSMDSLLRSSRSPGLQGDALEHSLESKASTELCRVFSP